MDIVKQYYQDLLCKIRNKIKDNMNNKSYKAFFLIGIVYRVSLDFYYVKAVSPQYAYGGLGLNPNGIKYILSWLVYMSVFLLLPKIENSVSSYFLNLQFAIIFAPMTSYYALNSQSTIYLLMVSFMIIIQIIILRPNKSVCQVKFNLFNLDKYANVFMIFFIPAVLLLAVLWGGFYGFEAFSLQKLNEIRKNADYPTLFTYLFSWMPNAIIPFYLAYCLSKKKYIMSICLVIVDILFYMVLGHKFIYLSLLVILAVFIFSKSKMIIKTMYLGLAGLSFTTAILYILELKSDSKFFSGLVNAFYGIRFLFGPANNKFLYYDFFTQYPKVHFSDGLIGKSFGLTYQYNGGIGQIIYAYMTNGDLYASNSNTGYFGDSYAQYGFIGLLVMTVILAYIIKFINSLSEGLSYSFVISVLSIETVLLNDGTLLTTLLSSGFAIVIVLFLIYSKPEGIVNFRRNVK